MASETKQELEAKWEEYKAVLDLVFEEGYVEEN